MRPSSGREDNTGCAMGAGIALVAVLFIGGLFLAGPWYSLWAKEMRGKADLREATWNRQIRVQEAEAEKEAAVALASAEVERARGVAQSNEIIGDSLDGNESYLRYLWIQALMGESNSVIYVPTEANLPILEANRAR